MREIGDILRFRQDISPFLAHLTRTFDGTNARTRLEGILQEGQLRAGPSLVSDARFGGNTVNLTEEQKMRLFGSVCFTETPFSEIHCLLEIGGRAVNLEPYGLVFVKDRLKARGVCPAVYINNEAAAMDAVIYSLFSLKDTHPAAAEKLLPLVAVFGQKIQPHGSPARPPGRVDFVWEREWRYPAALGPFDFTFEDVFCGLSPHEDVEYFEAQYQPLRFIDPRRNMKWYAQSLIESIQRVGLQHSVV